MNEQHRDRLQRTLARLKALQKNVANGPGYYVDELYVAEYHEAIRPMEATAYDLSEFKIDAAAVAPRVSSSNYLTGAVTYTERRSAEKTLYLSKVDAVIGYLEATLGDNR